MASSTFVGFRNRPIDPNVAIANQIAKGIRFGRNYQRQHITLTDASRGFDWATASALVVANGGFTGFNFIALQPGDTVVSATVAVLEASGGQYDIDINGTLQGSNLGGPWAAVPNYIDIKPYAVPASGAPFGLQVAMKNTSGAGSTIVFQTIVTVLR